MVQGGTGGPLPKGISVVPPISTPPTRRAQRDAEIASFYPRLTQKEIAARFGLSRGRVAQILYAQGVTADDTISERNRKAALARWGGGRIVRLDALDPLVRAAVLALVRADEAARASDAEAA
jgi:hypothetical protein